MPKIYGTNREADPIVEPDPVANALADNIPAWPSALPSLQALLQYMETSQPISLARAVFGTDFSNPRIPNWFFEESAYTTPNGGARFCALLFGRVKTAATYKYGHCTFTLDAGPPEAKAALAAFGQQIAQLSVPVTEDMYEDSYDGADIQIDNWTGEQLHARPRGPYITVHLSHCDSQRCTTHTPRRGEDEFDVSTPWWAADYAFKVGDWVLTTVTLHRRYTYIDEIRSYEILAHHLRVLPSEEFDITTTTTPSAGQPVLSDEPSRPRTRARVRNEMATPSSSVLVDIDTTETPSKKRSRGVKGESTVSSSPTSAPSKKRRRKASDGNLALVPTEENSEVVTPRRSTREVRMRALPTAK